MVATLHHLDARAALARMRDLLSPAGLLVVVGLARPDLPADLPIILASTVATRFHHLTKNLWQHPSPTVWPPPHTFSEMRGLAGYELPNVRYRRHLLWRYPLVWSKPAP